MLFDRLGTRFVATEPRQRAEEVVFEKAEEGVAIADAKTELAVGLTEQLPGRLPRLDQRPIEIEQDGAYRHCSPDRCGADPRCLGTVERGELRQLEKVLHFAVSNTSCAFPFREH